MNLENFLYTHPIFRFEEFVAWKRSQGHIVTSSLHSLINYYIKTHKIKRIRHKLFGVIPPNETHENATFDPYLIGAKAAVDSVLAYHSALELHGLAYSVLGQCTFVTSKKVKPFEIDSQWYQPVALAKALKQMHREDFGVQLIDRQGMEVKVTNIARTFVDVIDRSSLSGGSEEVYRSISNIAVLKFEELMQYCILLNNSTLNAKVGFFLDLRKDAFATPSSILKELQNRIPKSPQYMGNKDTEKHVFLKKWNLLVPTSILNQSWNEPNYDV